MEMISLCILETLLKKIVLIFQIINRVQTIIIRSVYYNLKWNLLHTCCWVRPLQARPEASYCSLIIAPDRCYRKRFGTHELCSHPSHAVEQTVVLQVIGDSMELKGISEDWSISISVMVHPDNALVARCPGWMQSKWFRNKHDCWK